MGATIRRHVCLWACTLTIGTRSFAAIADQDVHLSAGPGEDVPAAAVAITGQLGEEPDSSTQIVVIGTRIPRSDLEAVSPVVVIGGTEFRLHGATNVEELLNQLPQVNPSQGEFVSAGATGAATIDLRGLGSVRTLVLVNGNRLMPGDPRYPVPDINIIPIAMIKRVEILSGGAAAVYGSDAIAGVVNFVLDTDLDGFRIEGQVGGYHHHNRDGFARGLLGARQLPYPEDDTFDGLRQNLSLALGRDFLDERAHVTIYGGYRRIAGVTQDRRDYGACPITARIVNQRPSSMLECGGPVVSYPGNYFDNLGSVYQVTSDRTFVPGLSRFNYAPWNYYQRPDERFTAGGFATFDITSKLQAYAEVMAMKDQTVWQIGPSGNFRDTETINCDNPLLSVQQRSRICRAGNFVGQTAILDDDGNLVNVVGSPTQFIDPVTGATYSRAWLLIARRNIEGGSIEDELVHRSLRLLAGLKGEVGPGARYDASLLFGRVALDRDYRNNLSITRLARALDVTTDPSTGQPICRSALIARELGPDAPDADSACVPWDIFAIGPVTSAATAYLTVPPAMHGSFRQRAANVNATVELDHWGIASPWSSEGPTINIGAELRKDSVKFDPKAFGQAGDIAGFGEQVFPIDGWITAKEIFGEVRLPLLSDKLVRRLTLEGGFRRSWYRNSRSSFANNTHKVALDLAAVRGLRFRASVQGASRAPNILELLAPQQSDAFSRDPCAGSVPSASAEQCALTGVTAAQYGNITRANSSFFDYNAVLGGNEDLRPETATTRAIGIVVEPGLLPRFTATLDWWDIDLKGVISRIGAQTIVDSCIATGDPLFCKRIHRDSSGSLWLGDGYVDNRLANLGGYRIRGLDFSAAYGVPLGRFGSASFDFRGSYVLRWIVDNGGLAKPYDCAGLFGQPCGIQPRWKHMVRATWDMPRRMSVSLQWRQIGGVRLAALDPDFNLTDEVSPANRRLRRQDYFDLAAHYRVRDGLELRLGVNNVLDRQPPLVVSNTAAGGGPYNANTYPQWYDPLGRYVFASLALAIRP